MAMLNYQRVPICFMDDVFTYISGSFLGQVLVDIPYMKQIGSRDKHQTHPLKASGGGTFLAPQCPDVRREN